MRILQKEEGEKDTIVRDSENLADTVTLLKMIIKKSMKTTRESGSSIVKRLRRRIMMVMKRLMLMRTPAARVSGHQAQSD